MAVSDVLLFVYDLSQGLAKQLSLPLLGRQLDGIWHTSIVIFNREYFYGGGGIESCRPKGTILGEPSKMITLGSTQVTYAIFLEYLHELGCERFCGEKYNLFEHNCNTFSGEVGAFLTDAKIPDYITALPQEVMNTPIGAMLKNMVDSLTANPIAQTARATMRPMHDAIPPVPGEKVPNGCVPSGNNKDGGSGSQDDGSVSQYPPEENIEDVLMERLRKERLLEKESIILFKDVNPEVCVEVIKSSLPEGLLSQDEVVELESLIPSLIRTEDDDDELDLRPSIKPAGFLTIGKLLSTVDLPPQVLHPLVDLLQLVFLDPIIISQQKQDDDHAIMTFVFLCQTYPVEIQVSVFRVLCNICSTRKGHLWMTSEKQWVCSVDGMPTSNCHLLSALIASTLLSTVDQLMVSAATLIYNMTRYQVSDDFTIEAASALIQCLSMEISEELAYRGLQALFSLMQYGEVGNLIKIMGIDTARLHTMSERVSELCKKIENVLEKE